MIDHAALLLAIRARLDTLSVCTTGSTTLGATGTTYTRSAGSFLTDGFAAGMEVSVTGFPTATNNGTSVVEGVSALSLTVSKSLTTATAASGRTIAVGVPAGFARENVQYDPTQGSPWFEEELVSGPSNQITTGTDGAVLVFDPLYNLFIHVPENTGMLAIRAYQDAVFALFKPNTSFSLSDGNSYHVRTDTGPFGGSIRRLRPGFVNVRVTIPLRSYLTNAAA